MASPHGVHVFEVTAYSFHRCMAAGLLLRSDTFNVGGYEWSICFHPGGDPRLEDSGDYVAVSLELMTDGAVVEVSYDLALVDMAAGERWRHQVEPEKAVLDNRTDESLCRWCHCRFKRRTELEASPYLRDDRVVIECSLTVIKGSRSHVEEDKQGKKDVILDVPKMKQAGTSSGLITDPADQDAAAMGLLGGIHNLISDSPQMNLSRDISKDCDVSTRETVADFIEVDEGISNAIKTLCLEDEKVGDLRECTPREHAAILYIQSLCSSKECDSKIVYKSPHGPVVASFMRCLTIPSAFDGEDKYVSSELIDAYAAHIKSRTQGSRLLCPVWYGVMDDQECLTNWSKPEQQGFYHNFIRTLFEYDLVFFPMLVNNRRHWIVTVMNTAKQEFQILDSGHNLQLYKSQVESLVDGIAQMTSMARTAYPSLPEDLTTWEINEIKEVPKQSDRCSCGLYVMKFMEYWDGTKMQPDFEQEDIHLFRKKMIGELIFSNSNEAAEAKEEVEKIMKLLTGGF